MAYTKFCGICCGLLVATAFADPAWASSHEGSPMAPAGAPEHLSDFGSGADPLGTQGTTNPLRQGEVEVDTLNDLATELPEDAQTWRLSWYAPTPRDRRGQYILTVDHLRVRLQGADSLVQFGSDWEELSPADQVGPAGTEQLEIPKLLLDDVDDLQARCPHILPALIQRVTGTLGIEDSCTTQALATYLAAAQNAKAIVTTATRPNPGDVLDREMGRVVAELPALRHLQLSSHFVDDSFIKALAGSGSVRGELESLRIHPYDTGAGHLAQHLHKFSNLRELTLHRGKSSQSAPYTPNRFFLEELSTRNADASALPPIDTLTLELDDGAAFLQRFAAFPRLTTLCLRTRGSYDPVYALGDNAHMQGNLRHLTLRLPGRDGYCLPEQFGQKLGQLRALESLHFEGELQDAQRYALARQAANWPHLRDIFVPFHQPDASSIQALREALPDATVRTRS